MTRFALLAFVPFLVAADWPQWRGPDRTGVSAEKGWLAGWPADKPPTVAWTAQVGRGHSAVSVSKGRAFTMGWDGERDTVFCLDAATGKLIWKDSYPAPGILQWPGPRSTPTVDGDTVYTLSLDGRLRAYAAADGKLKWEAKLPAAWNPDVDYGFAWSPLSAGELLVLPAGTKGVGVRKSDGSFAWGNDGGQGACASPVPYTLNGKAGVAVVVTNRDRESVAIVGVDPATGTEQWRVANWPEKWGAACADPIVADGAVFVTTAEQHKRGGAFTIATDGKTAPRWENGILACYTGGPVFVGGHLYGVGQPGLLKCADWKTGKEKWSERGTFGQFGSLITADGLLLVQCGSGGHLVVATASPDGYDELRSAKVFQGKSETFTPPALANGRVYCRSYQGEVVCLKTGKD